MNEKVKTKIIEEIENIRDMNDTTIGNLEMLLAERKEAKEKLMRMLLVLKSKVKNDTEE